MRVGFDIDKTRPIPDPLSSLVSWYLYMYFWIFVSIYIYMDRMVHFILVLYVLNEHIIDSFWIGALYFLVAYFELVDTLFHHEKFNVEYIEKNIQRYERITFFKKKICVGPCWGSHCK